LKRSGDWSANQEPPRATSSWSASAKEISLPLNQRPTTVVEATMKSSEPMPSRKRPTIIPAQGVAGNMAGSTAMRSVPRAPTAAKRMAEAAMPIRSMRTPPAMSVSNAATL
jgi:hypothetical protein